MPRVCACRPGLSSVPVVVRIAAPVLRMLSHLAAV